MIEALAIASLIAWAVVAGALLNGRHTSGFHVALAPIIAIALAVAVLVS